MVGHVFSLQLIQTCGNVVEAAQNPSYVKSVKSIQVFSNITIGKFEDYVLGVPYTWIHTWDSHPSLLQRLNDTIQVAFFALEQ